MGPDRCKTANLGDIIRIIMMNLIIQCVNYFRKTGGRPYACRGLWADACTKTISRTKMVS